MSQNSLSARPGKLIFHFTKLCSRPANLLLLKCVIWWLLMRELANIMREIGSLRRIYGNYTVIHENIWTLRLILCASIAILGGNKTQMRETHAQCVRVGRSGVAFCCYVQHPRSSVFTSNLLTCYAMWTWLMRIQFDSLQMRIGSASQQASCESAFMPFVVYITFNNF